MVGETCDNQQSLDIAGNTSTDCSTNTRTRQYISTAILMVGAFNFGNVLGWSSPALPSIEKSGRFRNLNTIELSWIGSLITIGGILGSLLAGYCVSKFGRRISFFLSALPLVLGWMSLAFAVEVSMLYIGRLLTGIGAGALALLLPIYLSEISEPEIRGYLGGFQGLVIKLGILFGFILGSVVSFDHLSGVCGIFPIPFAVLVFYLPESPRYLLGRGQTQSAIESLCWLRSCSKKCPSAQVLREISEIQSSSSGAQAKTLRFKDIVHISTLRPLMLHLILVLFNQFSGGTALGFYTVTIFQYTETSWNPYLCGVIVGVFQVLATILVFLVMEKMGRKPLLIISLIVMLVSLVALGTYFYLKETKLLLHDEVSWIPLVSLILYNAAYCGGISGLVWTVMGELLPTKTIGFTSGFTTTFNWILAFITTRFFYTFMDSIGPHYTFWLLAVICGFGILFIYFCIPETKGISLEKIQQDNFTGENAN